LPRWWPFDRPPGEGRLNFIADRCAANGDRALVGGYFAGSFFRHGPWLQKNLGSDCPNRSTSSGRNPMTAKPFVGGGSRTLCPRAGGLIDSHRRPWLALDPPRRKLLVKLNQTPEITTQQPKRNLTDWESNRGRLRWIPLKATVDYRCHES